MTTKNWTAGWTDVFCIEHRSIGASNDADTYCYVRDGMGDMADLHGAKPCVWAEGRVAFDVTSPIPDQEA